MGNSATPAALARGRVAPSRLQGPHHGNHGIVLPAFIKVGGAAVEGVIAVTSPVVVSDQLPRQPGQAGRRTFVKDYATKFGAQASARSPATATMRCCCCNQAIPEALKAGSRHRGVRVALRDALEKTHELVGVSGIYTMSPTDHNGQDASGPRAGRSAVRRLEG